MINIDTWCQSRDENIGDHNLRLLTVAAENIETAKTQIAEQVSTHYSNPRRMADVFDRFGKSGIASFLRTLLPDAVVARSGDLGEIIATEYVDEKTPYLTPIKRLRWKDHRNQPMHGDDVVGIQIPEDGGRLKFLKVEAKSRASLQSRTITEAREGINQDQGLPSPHTLAFISSRLHETGEDDIADLIDKELLGQQITVAQVENMIFTFSGNTPDNFLRVGLRNYTGSIIQHAVGLHINNHQNFISNVFEEALNEDN